MPLVQSKKTISNISSISHEIENSFTIILCSKQIESPERKSCILGGNLNPKKGSTIFPIFEKITNTFSHTEKKLFIQFQDLTFYTKYKAVPGYLRTEEYDGGSTNTYNDDGIAEGWAAKRWNPKVQERFALLMKALGEEFDGKIEGINLQESAIGVNHKVDPTFTPERYRDCIKENMLALKKAFPNSTTMQYANFMPGEWLPWEDEGHLKSIYEYGQEIGVGLGGPDLMVRRKGQLNHALAMMHEGKFTVPLGIAIQDGNYVGTTGADKDYQKNLDNRSNERESIVPLLHAFAKDFLRVSYMFWVHQEPYFSEDVIPCLE